MQLQNEKYEGLTDKIEWTEKKYIKTSIRSWKNRKSTSMKESCFKPEEIPNMDSFKWNQNFRLSSCKTKSPFWSLECYWISHDFDIFNSSLKQGYIKYYW